MPNIEAESQKKIAPAYCACKNFLVGSFLSFDKKSTDNDVVTTSLPPALSFYWVCDLLCSHLEELLLNKEVAAGENKKQSASWLQLRTCHSQNIKRECCTIFWKRTRPSKKGMWYHAKLIVYLNLPRCYQMSLAQGSFVDSDRKRVRLSTNNKNNIYFCPNVCLSPSPGNQFQKREEERYQNGF